jgi:hypothetical protein
LKRSFHLDANSHLVEHASELGADRGTDLARHDLDRLGRWKTSPDPADDQIERIRENVKEAPLVPALRKLK